VPKNTRRQWIEERIVVLGSTDSQEIARAATELAASDDPEALEALGAFLRRREFLDRLDEPDSEVRTLHLREVLLQLIQRPSPEVARLCLTLVEEPLYLEHNRKFLVLEALASAPEMTLETAEAFRRANATGFFPYDALLLARNGSPVALDLFRSMMGDKEVDEETRVESLHNAILPRRTRLPILHLVASLMADDLEPRVATAAIESVFDYQPEWFSIHGPTPPGWRTASDDALRYVVDLGARVKALPDLPASLPLAIEETMEIASALLAARGV
jgi:hypothetical protein